MGFMSVQASGNYGNTYPSLSLGLKSRVRVRFRYTREG